MRLCLALLASFFSVTMLPTSTYADGLVRRLPEKGRWATYRMVEHWEDGTERLIDVTLKSLGSEVVDGNSCSWLEIVFETPEKNTRLAFRFLTPDKYVDTGADPLGKALRVWVRRNDDAPHLDDSWANFLPRLDLVVPAQIKNQTRSDRTEALSHGGDTLECDVVSGTSVTEFPRTKTIARYRLLLNAGVPFGVAAASVDATAVSNCDPDPTAECNFTRGKVEFALTSMGQNATSLIEVPSKLDGEPSDATESL